MQATPQKQSAPQVSGARKRAAARPAAAQPTPTPAKSAQPEATQIPATPAETEATPAKASAAEAAPAKATPASAAKKAAPRKATPAKRTSPTTSPRAAAATEMESATEAPVRTEAAVAAAEATARTEAATPPEQTAPVEPLTAVEPSPPAEQIAPPVVSAQPVVPAEPEATMPAPAPAPTDTSASGSSKTKEPTPVAPAISSELAPTPAELFIEAAELIPPPPSEPTPPGPAATEPTAPESTPAETAPTETAPTSQTPQRSAAERKPSSEPIPATINRAEATTRTEAWAKLVADPGHAPELLALAAVQSIGPRAREWLDRTQRDYPTADHAALARLATSQFSRAGGLGSIVGAVAGSYAPVALLGTAAVTHAELILHLAAAYGLDPLDPERAVDLLVLTHVHPDRVAAEAALAAARRPAYDEESGFSAAVWRLSRMITTRVGGWGVVRLISRYLPGVSLLTAFLTSRAATETVAARANAHYRQETSQETGR